MNLLTLKWPEFKNEAHRLASFEDWPIALKQKPKELVEAGFFYSGVGDKVVCFCCGGGLKHWENVDIPWEQHALWYHDCQYLLILKGQIFVDQVIARKNFVPAVQDHNETKIEEETKTETIKEEDQVKDENLCKICYDEEYNMVFFPCGHVCTCTRCAFTVSTCPYCRQMITEVKKLYFT